MYSTGLLRHNIHQWGSEQSFESAPSVLFIIWNKLSSCAGRSWIWWSKNIALSSLLCQRFKRVVWKTKRCGEWVTYWFNSSFDSSSTTIAWITLTVLRSFSRYSLRKQQIGNTTAHYVIAGAFVLGAGPNSMFYAMNFEEPWVYITFCALMQHCDDSNWVP